MCLQHKILTLIETTAAKNPYFKVIYGVWNFYALKRILTDGSEGESRWMIALESVNCCFRGKQENVNSYL
jgi:hypothetical protein